MNDAPERISVEMSAGGVLSSGWVGDAWLPDYEGDAQYVRADIYDALSARIKSLEAVIRAIQRAI